MQLRFLGTAGYHPNELRHTSCNMLPSEGFVLDAGTGFFRVRDHLCAPRLHIFLSHVHLDHVIGLSFLLDVLYQKQVERVVVYCLPEYVEVIKDRLYGRPLYPLPFAYEIEAVRPSFQVEAATVRTQLLDHTDPCIGFRFDWPVHSMAYITDTRCSMKYADFIQGVDLLIHECNFPDRYSEMAERSGHSTLTPVLKLAKAAGVKQLCLSHINPLLDPDDPTGLRETSERFAGTIVAMDGMEMDF